MKYTWELDAQGYPTKYKQTNLMQNVDYNFLFEYNP
jgi:hypothetical protein